MLRFFNKQKDPKSELQKILGNYELPSFSAVVLQVLTSLRNPDFSMTQVTKQLEGDPGLHVKVLKTVNSAAFGLSTRVSNLHHAVALLGRSRLETIVLSQAVNHVLPSVDMSFFDNKQFWFAAARRASLARILASHLHHTTQVESFTAGLLQDMALPVLVSTNPQKYEKILETWYSEQDSDLVKLENDSLGYNHTTVGALMSQKWGFPDYLISAIAGHHNSETQLKVDPAVKLVSFLRGYTNEKTEESFVDTCVDEYGMNRDFVLDMIKNAFEDAKELSQIMR